MWWQGEMRGGPSPAEEGGGEEWAGLGSARSKHGNRKRYILLRFYILSEISEIFSLKQILNKLIN